MNIIYCTVFYVELSFIFAFDDLSYNKFATQSHTSIGLDYDASNAVDGNIATCMRTREIGYNSPDKTVWWKVDLGRVYNFYSINILFKNYDGLDLRQRGRFAGFSVFVSNTGEIQGATLCYKDRPQLPPLNFTTTCTEYGRYVIFYNERMNDVIYPQGYETHIVYTELCEVIVHGCEMPGMYGTFCNKTCPNNCKEVVCHIQNGACFTCKPGWTGTICNNKCTDGWYGMNCSQQCLEHCRDGIACNHVTGLCDGGCEAGWTGAMCDKRCDDGTYGYDCVNNCSGHCLNDSPCNRLTGFCDMGCNPGYTDNCNKKCPLRQFGFDCKESCSGHCLNNEPCDHVSGECSSGCQDGYTGSLCNTSCNEGFYGRNCSHVCSPNCKLCRHTDGLCACKAGWSGPRCTEECTRSYGENCQYLCNTNCINLICDKFNGTCLFGCLNGRTCDQASPQNAETSNDDIACTPWIIAFSIALVISTFFIIATIRLWRTSIQRNSKAGCNPSDRIPASGEAQFELSDVVTHYQEFGVSKTHNTYQTLTPE